MTQKSPLGMPLWHMMPLGEDKCFGCSVCRGPVYLLDEEIRLNTGFLELLRQLMRLSTADRTYAITHS